MTDDKQIHEALRECEGKFLKLFRESPLVLEITSARDDRYMDVNDTFERMTGWTREEVIGRTPYDIKIMVDPSQRVNFVRQLLSGESVRNLELHGCMKNGEIRTGLASAALIEISGETCILTLIEDTTKLKGAEEATQAAQHLSITLRSLMRIHEEEHESIVRELHNYMDCLALITIGLDRLQQNPPQSVVETREEIGKATKQVEDLFHDIQNLSHGLRSSKLEYLGLAAAIASFCRELSDQKEIQIDFASEGVPQELPKEISHALYYVLQEALQNVVAHSGSQRAQVALQGGANQLDLTVRDWGIGFPPEEALKGLGFGFTIMKERLKMVGGELSVESQPELGTTVHVRVPLNKQASTATTS